MKVKELISKLQKFDPELPVVTPGFDEALYSDVATVEPILVIFNAGMGNHCGEHKGLDDYPTEAEKARSERAVLVNF